MMGMNRKIQKSFIQFDYTVNSSEVVIQNKVYTLPVKSLGEIQDFHVNGSFSMV